MDGGRLKWRVDDVTDWIAFVDIDVDVDVDGALAPLDVLKGILSAGGDSTAGDITPRPSLKYSWSLEGAAQEKYGRLVKD